MLRSRILLDTPGLRVASVACPGSHAGWSAPETVGGPGFVLVRRGVYRRRSPAGEIVADTGTGYVQRPGEEQRIAHPAGGDLCTAIAVRDVPEGDGPLVRLSGEAQVAHRALVRASRAGVDRVLLTDLATEVLAALLGGAPAGPGAGLALDVREALAADPGRTLPELARAVGASPYHVSRVFRRVNGVTLSRYRVRLRCAAALERLLAGDRDLAALAADLGFADQAHLTRALRAETGRTPGALRTLLGGVAQSGRHSPTART